MQTNAHRATPLILLTLALAPAAHAQVSFTPMGQLPGGDSSWGPFTISGDGNTVIGWGATHGYRWTKASSYQYIPHDSQYMVSRAYSTNRDGSIVGGEVIADDGNSWNYDLVHVPAISVNGQAWTPGAFSVVGDNIRAMVYGIDDTGDTYLVNYTTPTPGSYSPSQHSAVVKRQSGQVFDLGAHAAAGTLSADGRRAVGNLPSLTEQFSVAIRWDGPNYVPAPLFAGPLPGDYTSSWAFTVSADGRFVLGGVGRDGQGVQSEPFVWDEASDGLLLGNYHDLLTSAMAISLDGSIITGSSFDMATLRREALLWTPSRGWFLLTELLTESNIDYTGWNFLSITGISDDGLTITGQAINPLGQDEGFVMSIPTPGAALLLAAALITPWRCRRVSSLTPRA